MDVRLFSPLERRMAFFAGLFNLVVGFVFFFLPELQVTILPQMKLNVWPTAISPILTRFIGAIILGNSAGAFWLAFEREWARVRPLAIVATVYGTLVAIALLYELLLLNAPSIFWVYFLFDTPFLIIFYGLFLHHDILPLIAGEARRKSLADRQNVRKVNG